MKYYEIIEKAVIEHFYKTRTGGKTKYDLRLCAYADKKQTGVVLNGHVMLLIPDSLWLFDKAKLENEFGVPFKVEGLIGNSSRDAELLTGYEIVKKDGKELVRFKRGDVEINLDYKYFKIIEKDAEYLRFYGTTNRSPVIVRDDEDIIGVIMPVVCGR